MTDKINIFHKHYVKTDDLKKRLAVKKEIDKVKTIIGTSKSFNASLTLNYLCREVIGVSIYSVKDDGQLIDITNSVAIITGSKIRNVQDNSGNFKQEIVNCRSTLGAKELLKKFENILYGYDIGCLKDIKNSEIDATTSTIDVGK